MVHELRLSNFWQRLETLKSWFFLQSTLINLFNCQSSTEKEAPIQVNTSDMMTSRIFSLIDWKTLRQEK